MKRLRRWLKRIVLGTLALVIVAVGVALIVIHTDAGRAFVARQVEGILASTFPGGAKIGRIEGSPFRQLVVHDVVLNGPDGLPFIAIDKVTAEIEVSALLGKRVRVTRVEAEGLVVTNPRAPGPPSPEEPGALVIELPSISAHGAKLHLDAGPDGPLDLVDLDVFAALHLADGFGPIGIFGALTGKDPAHGVSPTAVLSLTIADEIRVPFAVVEVAGAKIVIADGHTGAEFDEPAAHVVIDAPRTAIDKLAPGLAVPGDIRLALDGVTRRLAPGLPLTTTLQLRGQMGDTVVRGALAGELSTLAARGVIGAYDTDLGALTAGGITGKGDATITVAIDKTGLRGAVAASSTVNQFAPVHVLAAFAGTLDRVEGLGLVTGGGNLRLAFTGGVKRDGEGISLVASHVGLGIDDAVAASGGLAPVKGSVTLQAQVGGTLDALAVTGKLRGRNLRVGAIGVASLRGDFAGRVGDKPSGIARLEVEGVTNAGQPLASATVDATIRPDRTIAVVASAKLAPQPISADVAATVTLGEAIDIAVSSLRIKLPTNTWEGAGGHVRIADTEITAEHIELASGSSSLAVEARVGRLSGAIAATLVAKEIVLQSFLPGVRGTVGANLLIEKRGLAWKGGGTVTARGLTTAELRPLDADVKIGVDGRRVTVGLHASNVDVGGVRVAVEVDGPRDLTDAAGWMRVARSDLHAITIGLDSVNARALTNDAAPGVYDGTIEIRAGIPDGKLRARGIPTPFGTAQADVSIAYDAAGFVDVTTDANVGSLGDAKAVARLAIAEHPFDVAEWKAMGMNILHSATLETSKITVDPKFLEQFGVNLPVTGTLSAKVTVGAGLSTVDVAVNATNVTAGPLREPISVVLAAHTDDTETTATMRASIGETTVLELSQARVEVPLARWMSDPAGALTTPLEAVVSVPTIEAKRLLAAVGRNDVLSGTVNGTIMVAGTPLAPTGSAAIDFSNIVVRPRLAGRPLPTLSVLKIAGIWDGKAATIAVSGKETGDKVHGTLAIQIVAEPAKGTAKGSVSISDFEIAPIAAFLPGQLVGASGRLNSLVKLTGLDATAGEIKGVVELSQARVPLTGVLGTLRDGTVRVEISDKEIAAKLEGKVGAGTVSIAASADPLATRANLQAKVVKLSPIGVLQPQIDASAKGTFKRAGLLWRGNLAVSDARVYIPPQRGNALLDEDLPEDLVFIDEPLVENMERGRVPERPFIIAEVAITGAKVEMPRFSPFAENAFAQAHGNLTLSIGETVGMDGQIIVDRGNIDLFGRRYDIEEAQVAFDGSLDPIFDVRLMHEFPDVTTRVRVTGRPSTLDALQPEFTAEPGNFSQSQLLGFFLGGNPSDTGNQNQAAAVGAGSSIIYSQIRQQLRERTGVSVDVLRCDPSAGTATAACTVGKWIREDLFVALLARPAARQNEENSGEAQLQYYFLPRLLFDFLGGSTLQSGDLLYRYRF